MILVYPLLISAWPLLGAAADPPLFIEPGVEHYPADLLAQGLEGDIPVRLTIAPTGELRCSATGGGPLVGLKRPSCELIAARDVFPPRTVGGKLVAVEYAFTVRWRRTADNRQFGGAIPIGRAAWVRYADYPPIARHNMTTGKVRVAFDITEYGRIENCRIERSTVTNSLAGAICPLLVPRAAFLPALGADGRPRRTTGWFNTDWRWCERATCPSPDAGP
jgi:TonB family protein